MTKSVTYGGKWTQDKLAMLYSYLDAYTTALKQTLFELVYVDVFAGNGYVNLRKGDNDADNFIDGSALQAIVVHNKPFDKFIFIENDVERHNDLKHNVSEGLKSQDRSCNCAEVLCDDANVVLQALHPEDWGNRRGVLFLDPFSTEVGWDTMENIAQLEALDTWILFPVMAISRILKRRSMPDEFESCLTHVYGDDNWKELYRPSTQYHQWKVPEFERRPGVSEFTKLYKSKLKNIFGDRLLEESKLFYNSKNSALFDFIFCVGNPAPAAISIAKRIASHIIRTTHYRGQHNESRTDDEQLGLSLEYYTGDSGSLP